ncbi:hypothetical protein [uncultured Porphyromonas sp.]|uniref:hypothetical protein n=1 Tax=uncultured Porphyromonas sp. TaxID=159274 RepID=UPI002626555B|nr:hypothetical protein [uncultured Porphyromonas sp.]
MKKPFPHSSLVEALSPSLPPAKILPKSPHWSPSRLSPFAVRRLLLYLAPSALFFPLRGATATSEEVLLLPPERRYWCLR